MQNKNIFSILVFVTLLSFPLFSSDVLTQYRLHGIDNIEKQLDADLAKIEYWNQYLQNKDTSFGYIESYANVLICDKSLAKLTLYKQDLNSTYYVKKEYNAFTGEAKGDKYREGDLKTPIGIYDLTKKITKVDSFYGPMAFVTSYPNLYDKYKGKNGSGIWIHGLPTEQERDEFTKGCIAINNKNIKCLDKNIDIRNTLLIINESITTQEISKTTLSKLLAQLYSWRFAWIYSDTEAYLNFYTAEFRRFDGMNKEAFVKYKTRVFNKQEDKKIIFKDINIIPYPNEEDTYRISFEEIYKSDSFSFTGNKVLIVKLINNKLQIITEQ